MCYAQIEECFQVSNQNGWFWFLSRLSIPCRCRWKFELSSYQLMFFHSCYCWEMFLDFHEGSIREWLIPTSQNLIPRLPLMKECSLIWSIPLKVVLWQSFHSYQLREWSLLLLILKIWFSSLGPLLQMIQLLNSHGFRIQANSIILRHEEYDVSLEWACELIIQIKIIWSPYFVFFLSFSLTKFWKVSSQNLFLIFAYLIINSAISFSSNHG